MREFIVSTYAMKQDPKKAAARIRRNFTESKARRDFRGLVSEVLTESLEVEKQRDGPEFVEYLVRRNGSPGASRSSAV